MDMKNIGLIIEALEKNQDEDSVRVLEEVGTNNFMDEIREMTAKALINKNSDCSLKAIINNNGKGINDLSERVRNSTIEALLNLENKEMVLNILNETIEQHCDEQVKNRAIEVRQMLENSLA